MNAQKQIESVTWVTIERNQMGYAKLWEKVPTNKGFHWIFKNIVETLIKIII